MESDVVIIGGGLGGLSAGAFLAQKGVKVAFKKGGFVFDVALHALPACAPGQPFYDLFSQLGINEEFASIRLKNAFNVYLGNYNFIIPNDFVEFFNKLHVEFPEEQKGIKKLEEYLSKYGSLYFDAVEGRLNRFQIVKQFIPKIPDFLKNSYQDTDSFLNLFIKNQKLKSLLYQAAVFFGEPMSRFPAINFIIMFYLLLNSGMYTIEGGGQKFSNVLKKKMLENNAHILTSSRVQTIKTNKSRAKEVILDDGRIIKTRAVIANLNTPELVHNLFTSGTLPNRYIRQLIQLETSLSVLQLHLGLDCPAEQIGMQHYLSIIFPGYDIDASIIKQNQSEMPQGYSILAPGIIDTEKRPDIRHTLSIVGGVSADKWINMDPDQYKNQKKIVTKKIINLLEQRFPGIKDHIKAIDLATPHTFNRYTQNPSGAILGFKAKPGEHRKLLKISKFPLENVFLGSAWTHRLGGFMPSVKAGISAAEQAVRYLNKHP